MNSEQRKMALKNARTYAPGRLLTPVERVDKCAPLGALVDIRVGTVLSVWEAWSQMYILDGVVVNIIPANEKPPDLKEHFTQQNVSTALSKVSVPTRPSKYVRYVVQKRPGRCFVYPDDPKIFRFYAGVLRDRS